jgi:hypothetical protein
MSQRRFLTQRRSGATKIQIVAALRRRVRNLQKVICDVE